MKIRVYAWIEFAIWLIIIAVAVFGLKYHHMQDQKNYKSYQIFMDDIDGLIVGSPVKFLGIQIGHVKNIKIISNEVYVDFIITQKGLVLPSGVVATVEGSGLGGSKALEIYPPDKFAPNDKIIVSKTPTRLGKVMKLFKDIFKELDSIITTVDNATKQLDTETTSVKVKPQSDIYESLDKVDEAVGSASECEKNIREMINKRGKNDSNNK